MEQFDIKLIKWGLVFLGNPAVLKIDPTRLEITKKDGSTAFSCTLAELKKANFNSNNGMWTLKSNDGQKCNIAIKGDEATQKFGSYLDGAGVKGFSV